MRILVTGASGFIGLAITNGLAKAGHRVRAASRTVTVEIPGAEWMELPDLRHGVDWGPLLDGIDCVIHLAAIAHRGYNKSGHARANHAATTSLVQACVVQNIKRLIFISSISAQAGSAANYVVTENDEPRPVTDYDRTKLAAEEEIKHSSVPYTILRPVLVYGPGAKGNIALMMRIARLPLPLGAFRNRRSLLSVDNLVQAVMVCLDNSKTISRTFIVCDSEPLTIVEMIAAMREGAGRPANLISIPPAAIRSLLIAAGYRKLWDRVGGGNSWPVQASLRR